MPFQYTATNTEGKKLTGFINAPDEANAREQLNRLGLSILSIQAAQSQPSTQTEFEKFEFEAIDPNNKKIKGTVPAKNISFAYKRLIEEYHFNVAYLAPQSASPEEKNQARLEGTQKLKEEYEILKGGTVHEAKMKAVVESPEFQTKKNKLLEEVDRIIKKINKLLKVHESKLSPEKKALVNTYLDKLLRIKSSNNLDYISNTCKELLIKISDEQLFIEQQANAKEQQSVMLESEKLQMDLDKAMSDKVSLGTQIKSSLGVLEDKIEEGSLHFLKKPFDSIKRRLKGDPELQATKLKLKHVRSKKWDAIKIALRSPKASKETVWNNVKRIREEEKTLIKEFRAQKHLIHERQKMVRKEHHVYLVEELNTFSGWLLMFYLLYYFIGHYITIKSINIEPFFGVPFDLSQSVLFKYLLPLTFLVHAGSAIKVNFFLKSRIASAIISTSVFLLILMTLFNF